MQNLSTLSKRGQTLVSEHLGPNAREASEKIGFYDGPWDPVMYPDGLVNLGTAENNLMMDDVAEFVREQKIEFQGRDFDYGEAWGSLRLRKAVSTFINDHFEPYTPTRAENFTIANGCSSIFHALGCAIGDPGDGVMLSRPSYVAFPADFGLVAGMTPIFVPSTDIDQFSLDIISCYEEAYQSATRNGTTPKALLLCNPHNPLGRCYPSTALSALLTFCATHALHLIVDEIYAMSTYALPNNPAPTPFTSTLSLNLADYINPTMVHHVYGLSKDFASGGLRIGTLYTLNTEVSRAVTALSTFHSASTISSLLVCRILENRTFTSTFLRKSRQRIATASLLARRLLDDAGIRYGPANAGFFLWIDLGPWLREEDGEDGWEREGRLMERLVVEKVFVMGGRMQGAERAGWFRFVFTREEGLVREGVRRLKRVCGI